MIGELIPPPQLFLVIGHGEQLELLRRLIHISGILTVVLTRVIGTTAVTLILFLLIAVYIISEYFRLHNRHLPIITTITNFSARREELSTWILCPISYAAGILIALNVFPEPINYATIAVLTVGDGFSSLVGTKCGRHVLPHNRNKTVEGSTAFFLSSLMTTLIFVNPIVAVLGSVVGTIAESFDTGKLENVIVPIGSGFCMDLLLLGM